MISYTLHKKGDLQAQADTQGKDVWELAAEAHRGPL